MQSLIVRFDVSKIEGWDSDKSSEIRYDLMKSFDAILKVSENGHWTACKERRGKQHWISKYMEGIEFS